MKYAAKYTLNKGWFLLLTDIGVNPTEVLRAANLPADLFSRDAIQFTHQEYFRFWQALDLVAADIDLPLLFAEAFSVEGFDAPLFASICCPNFNKALECLQHFKPLIAPLSLELSFTDKTTTITIGFDRSEQVIPKHLAGIELVFFTQLCRLATRQHIKPLKVTSGYLFDNQEKYDEYFGVKVKLGDKFELVFSTKDANLPFMTENAGMWNFFEPELNKRLSQLEEHASTEQRVKSVLLELIPSGRVSIENVASALAMSKRTLQRKLSSEKVKYQAILNDTRKELAQYYLSNSSTSLSEVSYLLGFQETTSFYRAFSSWTGVSPEKFRDQSLVQSMMH
ncbi:AraC family transcriptional regulator ligand-binding domain-containing protein [Vibrio parahaemolyticus]|uniref:AraC family transcriptional regulator n=1 Tax=Vibrio sp. EA2 TaxID=3079860 RepID=UPI002948DB5C|nr:AraC family transcriptional regulator ligand-binding domain-containing protein [Vibrio sp. EA2]MDV6253792.1 AraC family transcriptional regulator ligand-binding domain-containing protein [Vibrio sp. EA2]